MQVSLMFGLAGSNLVYTSPEVAGPLAYEAAMKALELDNTRAEVHYTLALMYTWGMFDWQAGEDSFKKAIDLKPAYLKRTYIILTC